LAIEKVIQRSRVIGNCLLNCNDVNQLCGVRVQIQPCWLLRTHWYRVFIATPTFAGARTSFVPSPSSPPVCLFAKNHTSIFYVRRGATNESSAPASEAVNVIGYLISSIMVRTPIRRSWSKRSRIPGLSNNVFEIDNAVEISPSTARVCPPGETTRRRHLVLGLFDHHAITDPLLHLPLPCVSLPSGKFVPLIRVLAENSNSFGFAAVKRDRCTIFLCQNGQLTFGVSSNTLAAKRPWQHPLAVMN